MLGTLVFENAEVRKVRTFYNIFLTFGEFLSLAVVEVLNGTVVTCYTAVNFRFLFAYGALIYFAGNVTVFGADRVCG